MSNIKKVLIGVFIAVMAFATTNADASFTYSSFLKQGSKGASVMSLQQTLNMTSCQVAASGHAGSPGMETSYFGPATTAAVKCFQSSHGLVADGLVGRNTGAALEGVTGVGSGGLPAGCTSTAGYSPTTGQPCNSGSGSGVVLPPGCTSTAGYSPVTGQSCAGGSTTPQSGPVSVSISSTNPAAGTIVAGQATADLAHLTFNGTGTVTNVTLTRTGVSGNDTLSNVYLYDGGARLTDAASVNSSGMITFNNPAGLFTVSGPRTISVLADIKAATSGQTVGVTLTGYTVMGQTASNTANVSGNLMTIANAGDLATAVLGSTNTISSTTSVDAGTSNFTVWGNTLQIAQRTVWLKGANFRVIGSAETGALQNARLIIDGAQVGPTVATVVANGNLGFDLSAAPVALNTGSHTIEVRADVVGGADRSFYLSLQNAGDLMLTDSQYNVNLTLFTGAINTAYSMNSSATITINSGTLSLAKDSSFNTTNNVTSGASNVTLAKYTLRSYGEAVKVMQVTVDVDLASGTEGLNNVALYVNGAQVGTSQNSPAFTTYSGGADANALLTYNLGSSLIVPAGQTVILEVRSDTVRTGGTNYTGTVTTTVEIPVGQAQGQSSYALYPTGTALSAGATVVTVSAATATVAKSSGFLTATAGTNASNVKVGSYVITAGTTEGLRVTNLAVGLTNGGGNPTTGPIELTDVANLRATYTVQGQSMVSLNSVNPQGSNNFSPDFTIPAGTSATVDVYLDVTNATAGETIQTTLQATARGASSNVLLTGTGLNSALTGQSLTVGSGTIAVDTGVTIVSSQATSQRYVIGGSSVEPIIRYNVKPTSGAVTIEELTFGIGGTANVITALSVTGVNGGSACSVQVPSGATTVTITGCAIPVPYTAGGTDIIVTPTINTVGINGIASSTTTTATVDLTNVKYNDGSVSATVYTDGTNGSSVDLAASQAVRPVASLPTLTLASSGALLTNGEVKIGTVTINASSGGNIRMKTLGVTYALSGGALTNTTSTRVFVVKEGNTTIVTSDNATDSTAAESGKVITFTNGETITAGSSRTFDIYMNIDTVAGGDDSAQILLVSAPTTWDDINGGGTNLVGTYILNFPSNSVTIVD